jgi:hypothetical protein
VGGGSAADVMNMRSEPGAPAGARKPMMKIEITCVDENGDRYDSKDAGYQSCLSRKKK